MAYTQSLTDQYKKLKLQHPDHILLMQVGVFMQVIDEDARTVSDITGLKLKMAGDIDAPFVVGGFPKSGLDKYVGMLVRNTHSVAIAFQNETKERLIKELITLKRDDIPSEETP